MNPSPKLRDGERRRRAAEDRALARIDRQLFSRGWPPARLRDQFFHLWERLGVQIERSVKDGADISLALQFDELSEELTRAQQEKRLPPALIRKLIPR